jgi:hypothetical protein
MNGKTLKLHRWWASHYGTMMAFVYLVVAISPAPPSLATFLQMLGIFTIASLGIGTFGHLLNDLTDITQDLRSGAQSLVASRSPFIRSVFFIIALIAAILPWWWLPSTPVIVALLAAEFLFFALYSIPPFRLKNRGILGPIADSLYAYVIPNLVAVLLFAQLGGGFPPWMVGVMAVWTLLFGVNHIVQHQLIDESRDRIDGLHTFVVTCGWSAALETLRRIIVPLEVLSFIVLLSCVGCFAPVITEFFVLYLLLLLCLWSRRSLWNTAWPTRLPPIDQVHLVADLAIAKFTWRWLPIISLLNLVITRPEYLLFIPLHLALFPNPLVWLLCEALPAARLLSSRVKEGKQVENIELS